MEGLFDITGREFYFDLERISDFIKMDLEDDTLDDIFKEMSNPEVGDDVEGEITETTNYEIPNGPMVDITKWEMTKAMIETVLSENSVVDEKMGITKLGEQLSIPFRLSFNTLIFNKIIKENE